MFTKLLSFIKTYYETSYDNYYKIMCLNLGNL